MLGILQDKAQHSSREIFSRFGGCSLCHSPSFYASATADSLLGQVRSPECPYVLHHIPLCPSHFPNLLGRETIRDAHNGQVFTCLLQIIVRSNPMYISRSFRSCSRPWWSIVSNDNLSMARLISAIFPWVSVYTWGLPHISLPVMLLHITLYVDLPPGRQPSCKAIQKSLEIWSQACMLMIQMLESLR